MKKIFVCEMHYGVVSFTVDTDIVTDEFRKNLASFWCSTDFSTIPYMLQRLTFQLLLADYDCFNVLEKARKGEQLEGWPPLDGTHGIYLNYIDSMEFSEEDVWVKETTK